MIIQNNGNRKFIIDGLTIEPHKTYEVTEQQFNRLKGFSELKPLCIITKKENKKEVKNNFKKENKKEVKNNFKKEENTSKKEDLENSIED